MEKESSKIDALGEFVGELRGYVGKALAIAQQKDEKLFGVSEKVCAESPFPSSNGLIEEITLNVTITMNNIHDIIEFLKKL